MRKRKFGRFQERPWHLRYMCNEILIKYNGYDLEYETKDRKESAWCVSLHGSETWSLKAEDIQRIEALEMRVWRRIEKVS